MSVKVNTPTDPNHIADVVRIDRALPQEIKDEMSEIVAKFLMAYHTALDEIAANPEYRDARDLDGNMPQEQYLAAWDNEFNDMVALMKRKDLADMVAKLEELRATPKINADDKDEPYLSIRAGLALVTLLGAVLVFSYSV